MVAPRRRARPISAWTLGDRRQQSACDLRASLPEGYRRCATRSDLREASTAACPARPHRARGKEQGETNRVERWFGTLRARVSPLVRKTRSFSKSAENHLDASHLFIPTYNFGVQPQAAMR